MRAEHPAASARVWPYLPHTLGVLVIGLGAALRLRNWSVPRSLWVDEAMVALNVLDRSALELTTPLAFKQIAPIGFLWLEKLAAGAFGTGEAALRSPALLAGLLLLPLVAWVGWRAFGALAGLVALALVAFDGHLIVYANELKPYGIDAFVAMAWWAICEPWKSTPWRLRRRLGVGACACVAVWFSFPVVFVIAGTALARAGGQFLRGERRGGLIDLAALAPSAALLGIHRMLVHGNVGAQKLEPEWAPGFLPLPPTSADEVLELAFVFLHMFDEGLGLGPWFLGLGVFLFALGGLVLVRSRPELAAAGLLPFVALALAAALQMYPWVNRLVTFSVPLLALGVGVGVQVLVERLREIRLASLALVGTLLGQPVWNGLTGSRPEFPPLENLEPMLEELAQRFEPGDLVYVYYGAQFAYAHYAPGLGLPLDEPLDEYIHFHGTASVRGPVPAEAGMTFSISAREQPELYAGDVERLAGRPRVWVVATHVWPPREQDWISAKLDQMGERFFKAAGDGALLWGYHLVPAVPVLEEPAPAGTSRDGP